MKLPPGPPAPSIIPQAHLPTPQPLLAFNLADLVKQQSAQTGITCLQIPTGFIPFADEKTVYISFGDGSEASVGGKDEAGAGAWRKECDDPQFTAMLASGCGDQERVEVAEGRCHLQFKVRDVDCPLRKLKAYREEKGSKEVVPGKCSGVPLHI